MPYPHHLDPEKTWRQQYLTTRNHILPFILAARKLSASAKVLEIGCGEGGVLKAFTDRGHKCYGIDISTSRIERAKKFLRAEVKNGLVEFYARDIHDDKYFRHLFGEIDLVILKDAIEHIYEQEKFMARLRDFMLEDGAVFLGFPPWTNPFGGHQQITGSILRFVPWVHLLPRTVYKKVLGGFGEKETTIASLLEIYETRLSVRKFEQILQKTSWTIVKRQFYFINPGYEYKFGLQARKQLTLIAHIPFLRDFASTAVYFLIKVLTRHGNSESKRKITSSIDDN